MTPHRKKRSPDKIFYITRLKYYGKPYDSIYNLNIPPAWFPNVLAIVLGTFIGIRFLNLGFPKAEAMIDPYISSSNISPTPVSCPTSVVLRQEIKSYIRCKDWPDEEALAIAECESKLNVDAINLNKGHSLDRGIFQINQKFHPEVTNECAFNAKCNIDAAYNIWRKNGNFNQWVCKK